MKKRKLLVPIFSIIIALLGILSGYMIGSNISSKKFTVDKYANLNAEELVDDISRINYQGKTPDQLPASIVFQIGAKKQLESDYYKCIGSGTIENNLGVNQTTYTYDEKIDNTVHIAFITFSSFVRVAQQATFEIGGDINMQHGDTKDGLLENVVWKDKFDHYTWEGYHEKFGKYANVNSSYIVSTKTTTYEHFDGKNGNLYTFSLKLDPILGTVTYAKQIASNLGAQPSAEKFSEISITFTVDENFTLISQDKVEAYSMPIFGMNVSLVGRIHNETIYERGQ